MVRQMVGAFLLVLTAVFAVDGCTTAASQPDPYPSCRADGDIRCPGGYIGTD